jgi:Cu-processing system ATP-binding protein
MITLSQVSKKFGSRQVLSDISLEIPSGKVVSLLGPNGSGKSTLIKIILDLVKQNSGKITIDGLDSSQSDTRKLISYMPQVARFPENISAARLFKLISELRGVHPAIAPLIEYFGLNDEIMKPLGNLSGGTKQKVSAVLAFLFDTPVIILDEPTVGLDPVSRVKFKELLLNEKAAGKTIFFTSHIMSDVEEVADEIVFLLEGKIVFQGMPAALMEATKELNLERALATFIMHGGKF